MNLLRESLLALILLSVATSAAAQEVQAADSTALAVPRRNIFQRVIDYINAADTPKPAKKFDFSILGGPAYTQDYSMCLGLVAAGLFRKDTTDLTIPPGQIDLYGTVSIIGYFKVGVEGANYFNNGKIRLNYDVFFSSNPNSYWGIGYSMNQNDANGVKYKQWKSELDASLLFKPFDTDIYIGPVVQLCYIDARSQPNPALWRYQRRQTFTDALGVGVVYDSRDNVFNAYSGTYARIDQLFAPKFTGNRYAFASTELTLSYYKKAWKGCVIASRLHGRLTYGDTPWGMMSGLGGTQTMRGYQENRYNDKCAADLTVEFRQHLFKRFGMVMWGGVGSVFPSLKALPESHALWNAGIGLRWEFKPRVNVRADYGLGQHQNGIVFSINEAF